MGKHNVTVEDSSPLIVFTGGWVDSPNPAPDYDKYSGYAKPEFSSVHKINGTGKVEFTFNGSAVYVFGSQSPIGGGYLVSLDSEDDTERDTAKNSTKAQGSDTIYQALLYSWQTKTHSRSPRKLQIDTLGDGEFALDYIVVESEQADEKDTTQVREITLDDTSPAFEYSGGSWNATQVQNNQTNIVSKFFENGTDHTVADVGGTVALRFRGTGAQVHGVWYLGSFQASLDGGQPTTIESHLGNPEGLYNRPRELLYMTDGLTEDDHTVVFTNKGFDDGQLQYPYFSIDYAIVSTIDPANTNGTHTGAGPLNTTTTPNKGNTASHSMSFSLNTALMALVFMWLIRFWRS